MCCWKIIQESPGSEIDIVSRIELGYSYELGSGQTRIRVMTRPRKRLGMVMTLGQPLPFCPHSLNPEFIWTLTWRRPRLDSVPLLTSGLGAL